MSTLRFDSSHHFDRADPTPRVAHYQPKSDPRVSIYRGVWSGQPRTALVTWSLAPRAVTPKHSDLAKATAFANSQIDEFRPGRGSLEHRVADDTELRAIGLLRIASFYENAPSASLSGLLDLLREDASDPWIALDLLRSGSLSIGPAGFTDLYREVRNGAPVEWALAFAEGGSR